MGTVAIMSAFLLKAPELCLLIQITFTLLQLGSYETPPTHLRAGGLLLLPLACLRMLLFSGLLSFPPAHWCLRLRMNIRLACSSEEKEMCTHMLASVLIYPRCWQGNDDDHDDDDDDDDGDDDDGVAPDLGTRHNASLPLPCNSVAFFLGNEKWQEER